MDDDEQRPAKKYPISVSKLSKTPSWIMLGFVLGALFVIALPPMEEKKPAPPPRKPVEPPKAATPAPPQLTTIEAVFEDPRWEKYALWSNDTTEVALWNPDTRKFSDFYEVRRLGRVLYYRTLTSLTRPIVKNEPPLPDDCPLRFTAAVAEDILREWKIPEPIDRKADRDWKPQQQQLPKVDLAPAQTPNRPPPSLPKIEFKPGSPGAPEK
jgi:hypothetical protein